MHFPFITYSITRFYADFNVVGKFFYLTAKMLRAQRNFDEVLITDSLNLPLAFLAGFAVFLNLLRLFLKRLIFIEFLFLQRKAL